MKFIGGNKSGVMRKSRAKLWILIAMIALCGACKTGSGSTTPPVPRSMAEVSADKLGFRYEADVAAPPDSFVTEDPNQKLEPIQNDFDNRRKDDALIRTVASPDGKRALALYATGQNSPGEFRVDLYTAEGGFIRNISPPEFAGAFAPMAAWSPDGGHIIFAGRKSLTPTPSPSTDTGPPDLPLPTGSVTPAPSSAVAPIFAVLQLFNTEQIYICDRDGFNLKPLTNRDGLIYFSFSWAPDGHAIAALACTEGEWESREKEHKQPRGRPRLIGVDGTERLLDDDASEAPPDWSPDSTKVAVGYNPDVKIFDAGDGAATAGLLPLHDEYLKASVVYENSKLKTNANSTPQQTTVEMPQRDSDVVSFQPIIKLDWVDDDTLFFKTAFVRTYGTEATYQRWHILHLSPQASLFSVTPAK